MIGILALQGAFAEHVNVFAGLGRAAVLVKTLSELQDRRLEALVIPGGESTTMALLILAQEGMLQELQTWVRAGRPVWGTCAGLILLADEPTNLKAGGQTSIGGLHVAVKRNAFGHQLASFVQEITVAGLGPFSAVFIRAPVIERVAASVDILATLDNGLIVAVRQGNLLGTSFHPELTADARFHTLFLHIVDQHTCNLLPATTKALQIA